MLLVVAVWPRGKSLSLSKPTRPWMALLLVSSLLYQLCYYAGVALLPLGVHNVVYQTTILAFLTIVTRIYLKEEIGKFRLLSCVVLVVGIVLVIQPEPLFHHDAPTRTIPNISSFGHSLMTTTGKKPRSNESGIYTVITLTETLVGDSRQENGTPTEIQDSGRTTGIGTTAGYILTAASGIFDAVWTLTSGRPLGAVDPVVQIVWMGSVLSPASLILMMYCDNPVWPSNPAQFGLIFAHSVGSMMHIVGIAICSQIHSPLVSAMLCSASIIVSFIMQHTVFAGVLPGYGNWFEIVGAIIVTIAIASDPLFNLLVKRRLDAQASWEGQ